MHKIAVRDCPYCDSSEVYRSHPKTLVEKASVLFLVRLVRCHGCMRRHYRPLFLPVSEYVNPPLVKKPVQAHAPDSTSERSA